MIYRGYKMKKSTLAIAVVVGLGVIWTGGAYYTGYKAETEMKNQFEQANKELAKIFNINGIPLQVSNENLKFERGVFSSQVAYDTVIIDEQGEKMVFPFAGSFYHGPLPLNLVKKLNFAPAMFSADIGLVKNTQTEKWFVNESNPFTNEFTLSYSQKINGVLTSKLKDVVYDKAKLTLDLQLEYDTNRDGSDNKSTLSAKEIKIEDANIESGKTPRVLVLNSVKLDVDIDKNAKEFKYLSNGNVVLKAEKIVFNGTDSDGKNINFETKNSVFHYKSNLKDQFVDYGVDYHLDDIKVNDVAIGKLQSNVEFNHLDASAIEKALEQSVNNNGTLPADLEQSIGLAVIMNEPQIKATNLKIERESGKFAADLDIHLAKLDMTKISQNINLLSLFKTFTVNASLDKTLFLDAFSQIEQHEKGLSKEDADKQAQVALAEFISEGVRNNLLVEDGNVLKLNANIEGEYLNFNGKKISNQELQGLLFLLALGMGSD